MISNYKILHNMTDTADSYTAEIFLIGFFFKTFFKSYVCISTSSVLKLIVYFYLRNLIKEFAV